MKLFDELKWRGLVKDIAGSDIEDKLNNEKIIVRQAHDGEELVSSFNYLK